MTPTVALVVLLTAGSAAQSVAPRAETVVRYWFENDAGTAFSPARAAAAGGPFTLHIRTDTGGFISVWDTTLGIELLSRQPLSGGHSLNAGIELAVPDVFDVSADAPERRLIIVWGRSPTEQAGRASGAEARLRELTARVGRDGAPQIVRETDDTTPGRVGVSVINREGMPIATEVVFRAR